MSKINRRLLLKLSLAGALLPKLDGTLNPLGKALASTFPQSPDLLDPETVLSSWSGSTHFNGDHEDAAHQIFWDKDGFLRAQGGIPAASESYDTVIVGGGIAGLSAAYFSRGAKTLLLEGHPQLGGNSKLERFGDIRMGLGAAYVTMPDEGDDIDQFYKRAGLHLHFRHESEEETTIGFKGRFIADFWSGQSDPGRAEEFKRVADTLTEIGRNRYPELPLWKEGDLTRQEFDQLDRQSAWSWLNTTFGEIHPHVKEYLIQYAWSSFGGGLEELSAAQFLNFITSDMQGVMALPGGNGAIAKGLWSLLKQESALQVQANAFVVNVRPEGGSSLVTYFKHGRLSSVRAKRCVVAAPKFVARYVIEKLSPDQDQAMKKTGRRAYLVANVLLKKAVPSQGFDCYTLHDRVPSSDRHDSTARAFSDILFADWANSDRSGLQSLTLYMPQPYDMAQQFLFSPFANEKHQARVRSALVPYLESLKLRESDIAGIRLTRYGHALPLAGKGLIANGTLELAHRPIDTIRFAGQCNWANPCFETAFETGRQSVVDV